MRCLRNPNRKPTHPGAVLREDVLPKLAWTQGEFATRLKVSRQTVSDLLHEKKAVTAEMAILIARAVGAPLRAGFACRRLWSCGQQKSSSRLIPLLLQC